MKVTYKEFIKLKNEVKELEKRLGETENKVKLYETLQRKKREDKLRADFFHAEKRLNEESVVPNNWSDDCVDAWRCLAPYLKEYKKKRWGVE